MKKCQNKRHEYAVVVFDDILPCPLCAYMKTVVKERRYSRKLEATLESVGGKSFLQKINPHK